MLKFIKTFRWVFLLFLMGVSIFVFSQENILERNISVSIGGVTVYQALNQIGEVAGCYFIYDSKDVRSDRKVQPAEFKNEKLDNILKQLLVDTNLEFKVIEKHVLIYKEYSTSIKEATRLNDTLENVVIRGRVFDKETKTPVPFVTASIDKLGLGTISNYDGVFSVRIPRQYLGMNIVVSHLGYQNLSVPIELLEGKIYDLYIQPKLIPIQEVFIRNIDAKGIVKAAIGGKTKNYQDKDIYLTSFYREGVRRNSKYLSYSEAVFKVFKSSYEKGVEYDQVRLLKSRKLELTDRRDTLVVKLKAGIKAALDLDIVKSIPDFLDPEFMDNYVYTKTDIVAQDSLTAYSISFEQKPGISQPLFSGVLYVDVKNLVLLGAEFEVNPKYVESSANLFVSKKDRRIKVKPEAIKYLVKYHRHDNRYYIHHIRGDLAFKVKERHHLFSNTFSLFFEYVGVQVDSFGVQRFTRRDILRPSIVFSEVNYLYDAEFWGELNTISPEEDISKALSKINPKIESIEM